MPVLKQHDVRVPIAELIRKNWYHKQTYYRWSYGAWTRSSDRGTSEAENVHFRIAG